MASGKTYWWAKDAAWYDRENVIALGEQFGPGGLAVMDVLCCKAEGGNWGPKATSNARRAMAQTRAMSRALRGPLGFVVNLAGYQATAAEEMPTTDPVPPVVPLTDAAIAEVSATISAALAAGVTGEELRDLWHATGSRPAQINLDAVATLTEQQAAKLTNALQERLP